MVDYGLLLVGYFFPVTLTRVSWITHQWEGMEAIPELTQLSNRILKTHF